LPGLLINCSIATYMTGSALIPFGLNWYQAFIGSSRLFSDSEARAYEV
jgi:hypothetical protein